jgi:hypothetical protein
MLSFIQLQVETRPVTSQEALVDMPNREWKKILLVSAFNQVNGHGRF